MTSRTCPNHSSTTVPSSILSAASGLSCWRWPCCRCWASAAPNFTSRKCPARSGGTPDATPGRYLEKPVVDLPWAGISLHRRLSSGGHAVVRCVMPRHFHRFARRIFHPQRKPGVLRQFGGGNGRRHFLYSGGGELHALFRGRRPPQPETAVPQPRAALFLLILAIVVAIVCIELYRSGMYGVKDAFVHGFSSPAR